MQSNCCYYYYLCYSNFGISADYWLWLVFLGHFRRSTNRPPMASDSLEYLSSIYARWISMRTMPVADAHAPDALIQRLWVAWPLWPCAVNYYCAVEMWRLRTPPMTVSIYNCYRANWIRCQWRLWCRSRDCRSMMSHKLVTPPSGNCNLVLWRLSNDSVVDSTANKSIKTKYTNDKLLCMIMCNDIWCLHFASRVWNWECVPFLIYLNAYVVCRGKTYALICIRSHALPSHIWLY